MPKILTLSEKAEIIEEIDKGAGVTQLSKKYGVAKSTICKFKKHKNIILSTVSNTYDGRGKRKSLKTAKCPKMEKALYEWFIKQSERHIPVTAHEFKEKSKLLCGQFKETENFNASDGWFQRFKKRYGIHLALSGENLSAHNELVEPFEESEQLGLNRNEMHSADKSGFYWKPLPNKIHVSSFERTATGRKMEKQCVLCI